MHCWTLSYTLSRKNISNVWSDQLDLQCLVEGSRRALSQRGGLRQRAKEAQVDSIYFFFWGGGGGGGNFFFFFFVFRGGEKV